MLEIKGSTFESEVAKSQIPVLLDLYAHWCGPCRMISPIVEELDKEYSGRVKIAKVNIDESPEIAAKYKVSSIPTLLIFKSGQVENQMVGVHSKSEIKTMIEGVLN